MQSGGLAITANVIPTEEFLITHFATELEQPGTAAEHSYNIAIKNRRGLSELSEARNSCCVAYLPDSCLYFQIATQIGRWELIAITR
jgi:hypothetical protein